MDGDQKPGLTHGEDLTNRIYWPDGCKQSAKTCWHDNARHCPGPSSRDSVRNAGQPGQCHRLHPPPPACALPH
jgi:hypothetical protein